MPIDKTQGTRGDLLFPSKSQSVIVGKPPFMCWTCVPPASCQQRQHMEDGLLWQEWPYVIQIENTKLAGYVYSVIKEFIQKNGMSRLRVNGLINRKDTEINIRNGGKNTARNMPMNIRLTPKNGARNGDYPILIGRGQLRKKYNETHPEERKESYRKYRKRNPHISRARCARRYAQRVSSGGYATSLDREWRAVLFGYQCAYCSGPYEQIDHVIALTKGGSDIPINLVPCCRKCNQSKMTSDWHEWYHKQSFYDKKREKFIEDNCK